MQNDVGRIINKFFIEDLTGIKIEDSDSLNNISQSRKELREVDKGYLTDKNIEIDIYNLTDLPNGRFRTTYDGVTFEMMFNYKKGKPLYVILNGAKTSAYPEFKRWSWYPFIQGSMLNIADPMYAKYPDLNIGWYYGDAKQDYRRVVAAMVIKIAQFLNIEKKDIILYGSSGGGVRKYRSCLFNWWWLYVYCY